MFAAKEAIHAVWSYWYGRNNKTAIEYMKEIIQYCQSLIDGVH